MFTFSLGVGQYCVAAIHMTDEGAFIYARHLYLPPPAGDGQNPGISADRDATTTTGHEQEPVSESWFMRVDAPHNEDEVWDVVGHVERDAPRVEDAAPNEGEAAGDAAEGKSGGAAGGGDDVDGLFRL